MPNRVGNKPQTFDRLFDRMDRNQDEAISKGEVKSHLKDAGVKAGLFGIVHDKASSAFIDNLDTSKDGKVTWDEFSGVAKDVMPGDVQDAQGRIDPQLADAAFTELDANKDGAVSARELERGTLNRLPEDTSFRSTIAEVAAKLGMDALDTDRNGGIERAEYDQAVADAGELVAPAAAEPTVADTGLDGVAPQENATLDAQAEQGVDEEV